MANRDAPSPKIRRTALNTLNRDRLSSLTETYGLEVEDRRVVEQHVEALMRSKSVDFGELLRALKREELQAMCDVLGLDRSGREKEVLVEPILGGDAPSARGDAGKSARHEVEWLHHHPLAASAGELLSPTRKPVVHG